jgi:hypothetical protein
MALSILERTGITKKTNARVALDNARNLAARVEKRS